MLAHIFDDKLTFPVSDATVSTVGKYIHTLKPGQDGRYFSDDIFKCIFINKNIWISIKISPNFVPKGTINNIPSLVQIVAWRRPVAEPMMFILPMHVCVTRLEWAKWTNIVEQKQSKRKWIRAYILRAMV